MDDFASVHISHHHEDGAGWPCPEIVDTYGRARGLCIIAPELLTDRKAS
jgi:hypothetical protein